jgi:hypothetical protein
MGAAHLEAERRARELRDAINSEKSRHAAALVMLHTELAKALAVISTASSGLDPERVEHGLRVLELRGTYAQGGAERDWAIEAAIGDIIAGGRDLHTSYVGTKDYAHWRGQSITHEYGYGPKHGTVVFGIGLQPAYRRQLTAGEQADAVYVLRNLPRIQAAQAQAARAARGA